MFKVWMDLLKEVPNSVLWLMKLNETAQANLSKEAIKHGVDPDRLVYATRVPRVEDHLARYRFANLFLDTFPYNGHTTAGDALRAGIPVLSIRGLNFASRVSASLLYDLSMDALVCNDLLTYFDKASELATDQSQLSTHKELLIHKVDFDFWPPTQSAQAEAFKILLMAL